MERMRLGPGDGPTVVHTCLGWALQGPTLLPVIPQDPIAAHPEAVNEVQALFHESHSIQSDLRHNVEKLWQIDVLPYQSYKAITRSKQDLEVLA